VEEYKVIAVTHKSANLDQIGQFHVDNEQEAEILTRLKDRLNLSELLYLSTCNRVEFIFAGSERVDDEFLIEFFHEFKPEWTESQLMQALKLCRVFEGTEAVKHVFNVACSIDSLVVGEREIITQIRESFNRCKDTELTGDKIRILIRKTIEVAKEVYTKTLISTRPVSVVSLAYKKLKDLDIPHDARILMIGAGQTNTNMSRFLKKHGFTNFVIFNRTLENGQKLADELKGKAFSLPELNDYRGGFDIIITCTGAAESIISEEIYQSLLQGDESMKTVIDLAIPGDLVSSIPEKYKVRLISVEKLKVIAEENLKEREKEIIKCNVIIDQALEEFSHLYKVRNVELRMNSVPTQIKTIKENAIKEVFAKELESLDSEAKEVLDKIVNYMEKKYISLPMKMAKEILLEETAKNGRRY
jgi:glutamyl-tRNA reductase